MAHNAVLGKQTFEDRQVIDPAHPPIIRTYRIRTGGNDLPSGLIMHLSSGDARPATGSPPPDADLGVLAEGIDAAAGIGNIVIHGTVIMENLIHSDTGAPNPAVLTALKNKGIYAVRNMD
ncbi:MAG: hypothetical protein CSB24_00760 [Deltaproteobacteria bacterium]|nr:MAG: hypothetical protein CSB24_00760 [Deltaproteobacteria bacterium]